LKKSKRCCHNGRNWWKKQGTYLDKDKMAENGIDPMGISQMIQANNSSSPSASFVNQDEEYLITTESS
jgi:multidrug efflux pump subunit AcrB